MKIKLKRLLDTKKKRIALGGLLGSFLIVVVVLLYLLLKTKERSKTAGSKDHTYEVSRASLNHEENSTTVTKDGGVRTLLSKQAKNVACEEALVALDVSVKATADQAILDSLLHQIEQLCPEDKLHNARMSFRNIDMSTEEGVRIALHDALEKENLNRTELEDLFQKVKTLSPTEPASTLSDYVTKVYEELKLKEGIALNTKHAKKLRRLLRAVKKLIPEYVD